MMKPNKMHENMIPKGEAETTLISINLYLFIIDF